MLDQSIYAIRRNTGGRAGLGRITRYGNGYDALAAWVEEATVHSAVGPRMRAVLQQVARGAGENSLDMDAPLPLLAL